MPKLGKITVLLPQNEVDVCLRVREARLHNKLTQKVFAAKVGITRDRLASYEYARAPVRLWLARRLYQAFEIEYVWLATGKISLVPSSEIESRLDAGIDEKMLFSVAYEKYIKDANEAAFEKIWPDIISNPKVMEGVLEKAYVFLTDYVDVLNEYIEVLKARDAPKSKHHEFIDEIPDYEKMRVEDLDKVKRLIVFLTGHGESPKPENK